MKAYNGSSADESLAYDYTRRGDGGTDNLYQGNDTNPAELIATQPMPSNNYQVAARASGTYKATGYFYNSHSDKLAINVYCNGC